MKDAKLYDWYKRRITNWMFSESSFCRYKMTCHVSNNNYKNSNEMLSIQGYSNNISYRKVRYFFISRLNK